MAESKEMSFCGLDSPPPIIIPKPYFDFLPDELLVEILQRLPQNLVHRCRSLSKRWRDITLSDNFIKCYIQYNSCLPNSKPPFALFFQHHHNFSKSRYVFSENPLFKTLGFSFDFLPPSPVSKLHLWIESGLTILSSNNGLVLCQSTPQYYYVCNPLTKKWVTLPLPNLLDPIVDIGFVCKSTSSCCSFRIVRVLSRNKDSRGLEIYDSDSRQWTELNFGKSFLYFHDTRGAAITCNGLIHWKNITGTIFVYDPYNSKDSYKTIRVPNCRSDCNVKATIGVCNEHLRCFEWGYEKMLLWELKDYDTGEWSLVNKICVSHKVTDDPWRCEYIDSSVIHPFDKDIVFLIKKNEVIECNTRMRKLVTVGKLDGHVRERLFPITLPCWPVPMPPVRSHF